MHVTDDKKESRGKRSPSVLKTEETILKTEVTNTATTDSKPESTDDRSQNVEMAMEVVSFNVDIKNVQLVKIIKIIAFLL